MVDSYVDWSKYWHEVIADQIINIEDYEPELLNTSYSHIKGFMEFDINIDLMVSDCEIQESGVLMSWGMGHDEDGVSLTFFIGNDDVIKHVEFR